MSKSIKPIDKATIHRITSGQVVIDLQNAVKELLENSLDAGGTSIEVRFYQYGLNSIEVIDNGCGVTEEDHESIALKHYTSKLEDYADLTTMSTFGFRGEALSSLSALCEKVTVMTATSSTSPRGTCLVMDSTGRVKTKNTIARKQGTTVTLMKLFASLPVRRKEFERNIKREYSKALSLLTAYALGPCSAGRGVRLTVSNQSDKGHKTTQIKTLGSPCSRLSIAELWGPKFLDNIVDLDINFEFEREKSTVKRLLTQDESPIPVQVKGLISKLAVGCGRTSTDRQFFYVNGRPCNLHAIQKAVNEVYRSFNANQAPFILADLVIPTDTYDVNVSPDKRTILIHHEGNLITQLKVALEARFSATRSTYDMEVPTQSKARTQSQPQPPLRAEPITTAFSLDRLEENETQSNPKFPLRSSRTTPVEPILLSSPTMHGSTLLVQRPTERASPVPSTENCAVSSSNVNQSEKMHFSDNQTSTQEGTSPNVVLNTSQTSWGRYLDVGIRPVSPSRAPSPTQAARDRLVEEPAKKKYKADAHHDEERKPTVVMDNQHGSRIRTSEATLKQSSLQNYMSSKSLRNRLASFAMPGSQLSAASGINEDVDEPEEDTQMAEDEEDEVENVPTTRDASPSSNAEASNTERAQPEVQNPFDDNDEPNDPSSILSQVRSTSVATPSAMSTDSRAIHPEIIKSNTPGADITLRIDVERLKRVWSRESGVNAESVLRADRIDTMLPDAGLSNVDDDQKAVSALSRVIDKQDFDDMNVVGQFNLGFIIVRRREGSQMDDLFIVDQHAADEKYNFEILQETTKIESQKLFSPQCLEFTAADEMLALENIDVLRQNGFEIEANENSGDETNRRLKLLSIPISKSTVFDVKDLEEIIYLLHDRPKGQMVRSSKARSMFASRACRKSVMIGMPLTQLQMKTVVRHMGTMDQPWNCPHGRPTMRHLSDIRTIGSKSREQIDWSLF